MVLKLEFKAESSGGLVKACITGPQAQMFWFSRSGRGPWKLHSDKISGEAEKPVGEPHFENLSLRAQGSGLRSLQNQFTLEELNCKCILLGKMHLWLLLEKWQTVFKWLYQSTPSSMAWKFLLLRIFTKTCYFQTEIVASIVTCQSDNLVYHCGCN